MRHISEVVTITLISTVLCSNTEWNVDLEDFLGIQQLRRNTRLNNIYLQFFPRSLIQCARECLVRRKRCMSINYSREMLFCELNYKSLSDGQLNDVRQDFWYSDISNWSKNLIGKCRETECKENEVCSIETGNCSLSDCGAIDVPKNSVLQNYGHHEKGNGVVFRCQHDFYMYNLYTGARHFDGTVRCNATAQWDTIHFVCLACEKETLKIDRFADVEESISSWTEQRYEVKCKKGYKAYREGEKEIIQQPITIACSSGRWEGIDFICKNENTMTEDYCLPDYTYNEEIDICYKYHPEEFSHADAQETCMNEHSHLLVAKDDNTIDFLKSYPDINFHIDGELDPVMKIFRGWAAQSLDYLGKEFSNDTGCMFVGNGQLQVSSCETKAHFMCQFELCPESAGYTYDRNKDLCYKYITARKYVENKCSSVDSSNILNIPANLSYNPKILEKNQNERFVYETLIGHSDINLKARTAYYVSSLRRHFSRANVDCNQQGLKLAKLNTVQDKETAREIINNRTDAVIIGLMLWNYKTYNYKFIDGTTCPYVPNSWLYYTDTRKCIQINSAHGHYATFKCSDKQHFICSDNNFNLSIGDQPASFKEAQEACAQMGKSLVNITSNEMRLAVKSFLVGKNMSYFLIDMQLVGKEYNYIWLLGGYVEGSGQDFTQGYSNDTKDINRWAVYNFTSGMFELIDHKKQEIYLCQSMQPTAWFEGDSEGAYAPAIQLNTRNFKILQVDKDNVLPFICEIHINYLIKKLNLSTKKKVHPTQPID